MYQTDPENVKKSNIVKVGCFYSTFCTISETFYGLGVPKVSKMKEQAILYPFGRECCSGLLQKRFRMTPKMKSKTFSMHFHAFKQSIRTL